MDYKKAYDSIRRDLLLDNMKKYRIDLLVINAIAEIYNGDETVVSSVFICFVLFYADDGLVMVLTIVS